jgi:hypothetical protein
MALKYEVQKQIYIQERSLLEQEEKIQSLTLRSQTLTSRLNQFTETEKTADSSLKANLLKSKNLLNAQAVVLSRQITAEQSQYASLKAVLDKLNKDLSVATGSIEDPFFAQKRKVSAMADNYPFLLFPVRIETRFVSSNGKNQLWIRVYPDSCNISVEHNYITEAEADSLSNFFINNIDELEQKHGLNRSLFLKKWLNSYQKIPGFKEILSSKNGKELQSKCNISLSRQKPIPNASLLPDRWIFRLYDENGKLSASHTGNPIPNKLPTGFDETAESAVAAAWLHDFDQAIACGMGIKIDLSQNQAKTGFSKIITLGLRTNLNADQTRQQLESLFENHQYSTSGMGLVPLGSATNNSDEESSVFRQEQTILENTGTQSSPISNDESKSLNLNDGAWLSQFLGIEDSMVQSLSNSGNTDQTEARRMNQALFPVTLGYFLKEMMEPEVQENGISDTEKFFTNYVLGRGHIPSIRIGKQPYGILPTSVFSRFNLKSTDNTRKQIFSIIQSVYPSWKDKITDLKQVSNTGSLSSEDFLQILALHPTSISYYQRFMEDISDKINAANAANITLLPTMNDAFIESLIFATESTRSKLEAIGLNPDLARPEILYKLFSEKQTALNGPVIEAVIDTYGVALQEVFSETEYLSSNYITWLSENDYDTIRKETSLKFTSRPLLFLLLKQACQHMYAETAIQLKAQAYNSQLAGLRKEYKDNQIIDKSSKSKHSLLLKADIKITGNATLSVADFLKNKLIEKIPRVKAIVDLKNYIANLKSLAPLSKAKLERALTDHIDCCSYRLDAWIQGMYAHQIRTQRQKPDGTWSKGLYTGAYSYVENVKPAITSESQGYILAPSQNHAAAAAILKNAQSSYKDNSENPFTINLSSERILMAKQLLDGVRNGTSLSKLLGYRFERLLTDNSLQKYQADFRALYPLVVDTGSGNTAADTAFQNRFRLCDGIKLFRDFEKRGNVVYTNLAGISTTEKTAFFKVFNVLQNIMDALKDLMLSEGVYQLVQSNFERGAATLDSLTSGKYPASPEVIQNQNSGTILQHKVGLHIKVSPPSYISGSLRASLEPTTNTWLSSILPESSKIVCLVKTIAEPQGFQLSIKDLQLEAIDLMFMTGKQQSTILQLMSAFIESWVILNRKTKVIEIEYRNKSKKDQFSFYEISVFLNPIRKMILGSRTMTEQDLVYQSTSTDSFTNKVTSAHIEQINYAIKALQSFSLGLLDEATVYNEELLLQKVAEMQVNGILMQDMQFSLQAFIKQLSDVCFSGNTLDGSELELLLKDIGNLNAKIAKDLSKRISGLQKALQTFPLASDFDSLQRELKSVLGEDLVFSAQTAISANRTEIQSAFMDTSLLDFAKTKLGMLFPVREWIGGLAKVRKNVSELDSLISMLSAVKTQQTFRYIPMQFPYESKDRWMAVQFMSKEEIWPVKGKLLYTCLDTQNTNVGDTFSGLIIDEWTETIPNKEETLGLAFHYNRPNAEAPQSMLLVTPPVIKGTWDLEDIADSVLSTIELSKIRAVEPEHLQDTPMASFSPAVVLYNTLYDTTVSTNLLQNLNK